MSAIAPKKFEPIDISPPSSQKTEVVSEDDGEEKQSYLQRASSTILTKQNHSAAAALTQRTVSDLTEEQKKRAEINLPSRIIQSFNDIHVNQELVKCRILCSDGVVVSLDHFQKALLIEFFDFFKLLWNGRYEESFTQEVILQGCSSIHFRELINLINNRNRANFFTPQKLVELYLIANMYQFEKLEHLIQEKMIEGLFGQLGIEIGKGFYQFALAHQFRKLRERCELYFSEILRKSIESNHFRHVVHQLNGVFFITLNLSSSLITDDDVNFLTQHIEAQEINFSECRKLTSVGLHSLSKAESKNKALRKMNLSGCKWVDREALIALARLPLKFLILERCAIMSQDVHILGAMKTLLVLSLKACRGLKDEDIGFVVELPQLEQLYLRANPQLTEKALDFLRAHPKLKVLDVSEWIQLTPLALKTIASIPSLEVLYLEDCQLIKGEDLIFLGECPLLRRLDLSRCVNIQGEILVKIFTQAFKVLKFLNVSWCANILAAHYALMKQQRPQCEILIN